LGEPRFLHELELKPGRGRDIDGEPPGFGFGRGALQNALVERLFRAYFAEGEDLTDHATLVRLAAEVGLPEGEIEGRLADASARATVQAEADGWRRAGISGVPTFIFDGKYAVSGAQEPETFVAVLDRVPAGRAAGVIV
jgi:predicted DsbA family dithiol-disulfide isomerase